MECEMVVMSGESKDYELAAMMEIEMAGQLGMGSKLMIQPLRSY